MDEFGPERAFALLTGEPFYFSPETYARLTDFQIAVIIRHAVERSRAMQRGMKGGRDRKHVPKVRAWNKDEEPPITRETFIANGQLFFRSDPERLGREYDEFLVAWNEQRETRRKAREVNGDG